jgi:hypothetical protein
MRTLRVSFTALVRAVDPDMERKLQDELDAWMGSLSWVSWVEDLEVVDVGLEAG